jgi:multidrug resistance protein, MATE family
LSVEPRANSWYIRMMPIDQAKVQVPGILKESWSFGWPMILIMFFHFSIGMADVYVAGYLGTEVLAAVGYVAQLYWTLMILANGITVGTVSMVSQAYGAKSDEGVGNITANALIMGFAIAGVIAVAAYMYPAAIVRASGMPEGIQEIGERFLRIFSLVLVPTYVMILTGGVLRSSGRVRVAMVNTLIASVVTVIGDLVLGLGWGLPSLALGYTGIAWATAIGTTLGMVLNFVHMLHGPDKITRSSLTTPLVGCMKNLIKLGVPSALQQVAWNAGTLVVYFLVAHLEGGQIAALAAMTAGVRIEAIIFLPIFALNMSAAVLTGNRLGVGDVSGARASAKATAWLCLLITFLPSLIIFALARTLAGLLTSDPAVLDEMTRYLRINMIGMPFFAVGVTLSGALQGAGDTVATMRIIFTGMWLLRIPMILVVIYVIRAGATGVWCCMTISIVLMCALLINRFRGDAWTRASIDKTSKTMLWHACLGRSQIPPSP